MKTSPLTSTIKGEEREGGGKPFAPHSFGSLSLCPHLSYVCLKNNNN
jgi:hypothetical protein